MRFEWRPGRGGLQGKFVFLSASVPDPQRDGRFLQGPLDQRRMLKVIDQRVDDAVKSLLAHTLDAGGRIVHGGQRRILRIIAHQTSNWKIPDGVEPPIRIYQSEFFRKKPAPPGREELEQNGVGRIIWVSNDVNEITRHWQIPTDRIQAWVDKQGPATNPPGQNEALLAMRWQMLLESQPVEAFCIGGMEGIEAEARLHIDLAKQGRLPGKPRVIAMRSTYGATAQLTGEEVCFGEKIAHKLWEQNLAQIRSETHGTPFHSLDAPSGHPPANAIPEDVPPPSKETAKSDFKKRVSYDAMFRLLIADIAQHQK